MSEYVSKAIRTCAWCGKNIYEPNKDMHLDCKDAKRRSMKSFYSLNRLLHPFTSTPIDFGRHQDDEEQV